MSQTRSNTMTASNTPTWKIAALWALVTIPALWGFIETLIKSMALFTG